MDCDFHEEAEGEQDISIMSYEENYEEISTMSHEEYEETSIISHESISEEQQFEELDESKACTEFPNEAYEDLMVLITKHNLNNKAGNAIIRFFNKHSNLPKSLLPKNIESGRRFMNNMKCSNLEFNKTCILRHNNREYFLYNKNLIHCIKNILGVPEITKDFALSFENYEVY